MWAVGINITSSILFETPVIAGGYGYGALAVGCLYFTPVVAVSLGEFFGHFFNDYLADRYVRKHDGLFRPEARLWTNYIAAGLMIPGLIIVGQALEKHLSVGAIIMGYVLLRWCVCESLIADDAVRWGMYVFGVMIASVAITAYALDCYPTGSGEVSSFLNFARTIAGFAVGYFQQPWGAKDGYGLSFGIQAIVVAIALVLLILIHRFGQTLREKGGPLKL